MVDREAFYRRIGVKVEESPRNMQPLEIIFDEQYMSEGFDPDPAEQSPVEKRVTIPKKILQKPPDMSIKIMDNQVPKELPKKHLLKPSDMTLKLPMYQPYEEELDEIILVE